MAQKRQWSLYLIVVDILFTIVLLQNVACNSHLCIWQHQLWGQHWQQRVKSFCWQLPSQKTPSRDGPSSSTPTHLDVSRLTCHTLRLQRGDSSTAKNNHMQLRKTRTRLNKGIGNHSQRSSKIHRIRPHFSRFQKSSRWQVALQVNVMALLRRAGRAVREAESMELAQQLQQLLISCCQVHRLKTGVRDYLVFRWVML